MRTKLLGNLPTFNSGRNKNRLDRVKTAKIFGWSKEEIYKAYNNWIQIFRKENSTLTFEQYCYKMKEIGINPYDVGCSVDKYSLSRYTDDGPYTNASCRFILTTDNHIEQYKHGKVVSLFQKGNVPWNKGLKLK